jgi:DNA-binding MarR family transcriptional regulator
MTHAAVQETAAREQALDELDAALKGIMGALKRLRGRETHRQGELSFAQYHLLFGLSEQEQPTTNQLAVAAQLAPATVTQMLDGLVAMGLVERTRSDRDRRVVTCELTDRGRKLIDEKRARWEKRWRETLSRFGNDELATAAAVLDHLRSMFDALTGDAR